MSENADRDAGRRGETSPSDEAVLSYFETGRPFRTAPEVAERFDLDRATASGRLAEMAADGHLEEVRLGEQTVVWWRHTETGGRDGFDENDPLFTAEPFTAGESVSESEIDDVLYGASEP